MVKTLVFNDPSREEHVGVKKDGCSHAAGTEIFVWPHSDRGSLWQPHRWRFTACLGLDGLVKHLAEEVKVKQAKGQGFAAEG